MSIEQELLRMLEARKPLWPFDAAIDTAYVRKLYALYGAEINLVEKFFLWESYYSGKPARERTNPRLAFHKWCINGVALKKKYATVPPKPPSTPRTINDLAAGIAAAKAPGRGDTPVAHGGMIAAATPAQEAAATAARPQPTQEELESNRQRQLTDYRKKREEG